MTASDVRIRQATAVDAVAIAGLIGALLGEIIEAIGAKVFDFDVEASALSLSKLIGSGRYTAFVAANADGKAVGVITLSESCALYAGGLFGTIPEFYVEPGWRSRGVGAALADAARAHARSLGWPRLEVTTPPLPEFDRTLAFYERCGFAVTGGRKLKIDVQP